MATRTSIPHYVWAGGHAAVLLASLYCFIGVVTFKPHPYAYKLAFSGAIGTLMGDDAWDSWTTFVQYKSLGIPSASRAYLQKALLDENVQFLLLALYWNLGTKDWMRKRSSETDKPIPLALVPFATFSLFHTLTFVRTLLPKPSAPAKKTDKPSSTPAPPPASGPAVELNKRLQVWIKKNYEGAMIFVSYFEVVVIMGRVLLGAIT
ncbi:Transmembrane nucleoporin [Cystobasidiomycetes sp. EMM_F5]